MLFFSHARVIVIMMLCRDFFSDSLGAWDELSSKVGKEFLSAPDGMKHQSTKKKHSVH